MKDEGVKKDVVKELSVIEPEMNIEAFGTQKTSILALVGKQMKEGQDFGIIPGTSKRTLYQPGAEKLAKFFGLAPEFTLKKEIEDISTNFAYYRYECKLIHIASGKVVGTAERSCNSKEGNKLKKSFYDLLNTCQALAQKRALVASVRTATMATDIFADDVPDSKVGPTTKIEDPMRSKLIAKLHIVAKERGFTDEIIHNAIREMHAVESITELTSEQIYNLTEKMLSSYQIVELGQSPLKIGSSPKIEETGPEDTASDQVEVVEEKSMLEGEDGIIEPQTIMDAPKEEDKTAVAEGSCYNCGLPLPDGVKYYCNDKCKDAYWEGANKRAKEKFNLNK